MAKLKFGDKVWHDDYGLGFVIQVNGFENDLTYSVMFENRVICGKDIKLTKVTDWISCNKAMPEFGANVLITDMNDVATAVRIHKDWDDESGFSNIYLHATHWMPLPDMPEKEEI